MTDVLYALNNASILSYLFSFQLMNNVNNSILHTHLTNYMRFDAINL